MQEKMRALSMSIKNCKTFELCRSPQPELAVEGIGVLPATAVHWMLAARDYTEPLDS
jgi:hypothetical protein